MNMLLTIALIILALWILGFAIHIGGALIHLLLIIGVILLIAHLLRGRRRRTIV
ncbi:MAG TPA: lmo0937 family membrane protein [Candidatus Saccharimonadales bacterium]|nr:lmo0937 family membrane protein [Candidatus Saccharimonadales bacterium]